MTIIQDQKVTILISVYNGAETLDRCFDSLANQSYRDFAIMAINDCSKDDSLILLQKWQAKFGRGRFTLMNNEGNLGLTKSLNLGLGKITTPYTARVDADDWWDKDKLACQMEFLADHPDFGLIGCNFINVKYGVERKNIMPKTDETIRATITRRNPFAHSCVIFKTDLVKGLGGYDEQVRYGQDYDLWFRVLPLTKLHNLQEFLCYRAIDRGISVEKQKAQMRQCLKTQVKYIRKYHLPILNYLNLIEPLMLVVTPDWIKKVKRRVLS